MVRSHESSKVINDRDELKHIFENVLAKGPFPTKECAEAQIEGKRHGELILYVADIAGLASRGQQGLASLSHEEKARFRGLTSISVFDRFPEFRQMIRPETSPKLHALLVKMERARKLILQALR